MGAMADDERRGEYQPGEHQPVGDAELTARLPTGEDLANTQPVSGAEPVSADEPPASAGGDEPVRAGADGSAETAVLGTAAGGTPAAAPGGRGAVAGARERWAARAEVRPAVVDETVPPDQWQELPPERPWWLPAVLALVALLLLAILGFGIWLIMQAFDAEPTPEPTAPPTRPPTSAPVATSAPATSAAPSPTPPSPTPPAQVAVPPVVGLPLAEAQRLLDAAGLTYRVSTRVDRGATPGTVIGVRPEVGAMVAPGSQVALVVAEEPPAATPASPTSSPSPGPPT